MPHAERPTAAPRKTSGRCIGRASDDATGMPRSSRVARYAGTPSAKARTTVSVTAFQSGEVRLMTPGCAMAQSTSCTAHGEPTIHTAKTKWSSAGLSCPAISGCVWSTDVLILRRRRVRLPHKAPTRPGARFPAAMRAAGRPSPGKWRRARFAEWTPPTQQRIAARRKHTAVATWHPCRSGSDSAPLEKEAHRSKQATALRRATGTQFVVENAKKPQDQLYSRALQLESFSGEAKPSPFGPLKFAEFDGQCFIGARTSWTLHTRTISVAPPLRFTQGAAKMLAAAENDNTSGNSSAGDSRSTYGFVVCRFTPERHHCQG